MARSSTCLIYFIVYFLMHHTDDRYRDHLGNSSGECYCVDGVILMKGERL